MHDVISFEINDTMCFDEYAFFRTRQSMFEAMFGSGRKKQQASASEQKWNKTKVDRKVKLSFFSNYFVRLNA